MTIPEVIDLSSDAEDCMDDTGAEVSGLETAFLGSDNGKRKDYCMTETVKQELFEQPSNGLDSGDGRTFIMPPKKQVQNSIAQSDQRGPMQTTYRDAHNANSVVPPYPAQTGVCRQFWKAGDYDVRSSSKRTFQDGMDHVRVHPKFLHSNATSHKWALGAIAELLDNAIDEEPNGATFVNVDKITNPKDDSPALLVQDDGGGMDPDCMRQCMSLGYSRKSKNTIGQYGNGFKTSTMRLGADVIVFSCCNLTSVSTQSVGLLSYTFLRETGHEDIIVPMVDYELSFSGQRKRLIRSTAEDWSQNLLTLLQWSPYSTEADLLKQFDDIGPHGTKVIVYNLWLNDDGQIELDFESDKNDITLRGGPKAEKADVTSKQQLSEQHISNRLRYSLRLYASILYLNLPEGFEIILRGRVVEHRKIANDLKFSEYILYKPQVGGSSKEVSVITTIGFTKEAPLVNVHGFNVYHKNRLIMPFWRVFHENSSRGRGVVGVLEANFIEPAHDKQDFEKTAVLLRLETRLKQMTIEYWNLHCALIGYQPSNAKPIKPRNVPSNTSGPASGNPVGPTSNHPAGPYEAVQQSVSNSSTPLGEIASPSPNFVPLTASLQVEGCNASTQHLNCGANTADVDTKPAALRPGAINQPHSLSRIPPVRGTSPNTSTSEETPSGTINSSLSVPLGRGVNATASAPSTPPQQFSDLEDFTSNQFRCQGNGWTARRREEINSTQENGQGRFEDSASSPLLSNIEREHHTSNGPLSGLSNGCASTMPKTKRKYSELNSSELESPKRRAFETVNGSANDDHLNIQSVSDDAEIGSIPITEQPALPKNKAVNCQEVEEFLEQNRKLQAQCHEYEFSERELEQRVRELENELQEIQREYAKLLIESQSLSTVKEET